MWWYVASFVSGLVLSYAAAPKPQQPTPASFSDLEVPIAEEGAPIPVLFGTRDLNAPNVVWYGDLKTVAIKSKGGKK
jgi:hypothetical protein